MLKAERKRLVADVDPSAQSGLAAVEAELTRLSEEITAAGAAAKTDSNASVLSSSGICRRQDRRGHLVLGGFPRASHWGTSPRIDGGWRSPAWSEPAKLRLASRSPGEQSTESASPERVPRCRAWRSTSQCVDTLPMKVSGKITGTVTAKIHPAYIPRIPDPASISTILHDSPVDALQPVSHGMPWIFAAKGPRAAPPPSRSSGSVDRSICGSVPPESARLFPTIAGNSLVAGVGFEPTSAEPTVLQTAGPQMPKVPYSLG